MGARRTGSKLYSLVMFLAVSVLAGLLTAGLYVPVVALASGTAKASADAMASLPQQLITPPQAEGSKILLADGSVLASFYDENRQYVTLAQIAPVMRQAQVAIEDHRFYEHGAIDVKGLLRAFTGNIAGGDTQGGSTLTQQYVKLVRMQIAQEAGDPEAFKKAQEKSYSRKIIEMRYAVALEKQLSKDEILERYLNIAFYGDRTYGVQAAAVHYFGVNAKDLTLDQAAMLAGLVQNPSTSDPINHPQTAIARRNLVLNRMASPEVGQITQAQAEAAKAIPFDRAKVVNVRQGCANSRFPFICQYVERTLLSDQMPALGADRDERENLLRRGGLTIQTLIDPQSQDAAQMAVSGMIDPRDPVISTVAMLEPKTGLIIAMAQSRPAMGNNKEAGQTFYNYNVSYDMGGAEGYQAGSTFKIFTLANALAKGIDFNHLYRAPNKVAFQGDKFISCNGTFTQRSPYSPKNVGSYRDPGRPITLFEATRDSVNTYFVQLERDSGICGAVQMAQAAGAKVSMPNPTTKGKDLVKDFHYDTMPSFTLGTVEVTPLSMAESYATFANNGIHCDPIVLQAIKTRDGHNVPVPSANCQQVIDPNVAAAVNFALSEVMKTGSGRRGAVPGGYPQAGKTGTIDGSEAVWLVGYTPEVAGAAMIAVDKTNPYWQQRTRSLGNITLPYSKTRLRGVGGQDAARLWQAAMTSALRDRPKTPFATYTPPPPPTPSPRPVPKANPTTAAPIPTVPPATVPPATVPPATVPPATVPPATVPPPVKTTAPVKPTSTLPKPTITLPKPTATARTPGKQ